MLNNKRGSVFSKNKFKKKLNYFFFLFVVVFFRMVFWEYSN